MKPNWIHYASLQLWRDIKEFHICRAKTLWCGYDLQRRNQGLEIEHFSLLLPLGGHLLPERHSNPTVPTLNSLPSCLHSLDAHRFSMSSQEVNTIDNIFLRSAYKMSFGGSEHNRVREETS